MQCEYLSKTYLSKSKRVAYLKVLMSSEYQGRGKVFYVGCEVGGGGGGGGGSINITPNRNRKSCYSLRTFMRSC